MKEQIRSLIAGTTDRLSARNQVMEYLQARVLQFIQENGLFARWIFHGGTALRFLFLLPRYSEDLDFSLAVEGDAGFSTFAERAGRWFAAETYRVEVKVDERRTVKSAFIRFPGLLHEFGLSAHSQQALAIKIELDSRPPAGGTVETTVVRRHVVLNLMHYDRASLLSGKLHALFSRPYTKGRDLFDVFWYLSDPAWPVPNLPFLNAALKQTGWKGAPLNGSNWTRAVTKKLSAVDWRRAVTDVRPFIERTAELDLLTRDNVLKLLRARQA